MDKREEELLLHVAAGTDPLTALAALPDEPEPKKSGAGCLIALIAALLAVLAIRACR